MEFIIAHPLIVAIVASLVSALFAFFAGHYLIVPKRCEKQIKKCRDMISSEFDKRDTKKKDCIDDIEDDIEKLHGRISAFANKADEVYVRRDAVLPQLENIQKEIAELRKVIFKFVKTNGHGE